MYLNACVYWRLASSWDIWWCTMCYALDKTASTCRCNSPPKTSSKAVVHHVKLEMLPVDICTDFGNNEYMLGKHLQPTFYVENTRPNIAYLSLLAWLNSMYPGAEKRHIYTHIVWTCLENILCLVGRGWSRRHESSRSEGSQLVHWGRGQGLVARYMQLCNRPTDAFGQRCKSN